MPQGTVKWFNTDKGFGFIQQGSGQDLFVHVSEVQDESITEGDAVEFEIGEGRKGPCATSVRRAS